MRRVYHFLILFTITTGLLGCVDLRNVGHFANATTDLVQASDSFFASAIVSDNEFSEAFDLDTDKFAEFSKQRAAVLKGLRYRQAAVGSLAAYANALKQLADLDQADEVEAASKKLSGSLASFSKTLDVSLPEESALATAITKIAGAFIKVEQRRVVRQAVSEAHPHVESVLKVLKTEVDKQKGRLIAMRGARTAARESLIADLKNYNQPKSPDKLIHAHIARQIVKSEGIDLATANAEDAIVAALDKAVKSCGAAHEKLNSTELDIATLAQFASEASDAVKAAAELFKTK